MFLFVLDQLFGVQTKSICIFVPLWHASLAGTIINEFLGSNDEKYLQNISKVLVENYKQWFSQDTIHKIILEEIKNDME